MASGYHLLLTMGGSYSPTPLQVEGWQMGVRLFLGNTTGVDSTGDLVSFPVSADSAAGTDGDWTWDTNWQVNWTVGGQFDPGDWLSDVGMPAVEAFINSAAFSSKIRCTDVRLYPIGSNGLAVRLPGDGSGRSARGDFTVATGGSGGSSLLPLQIAGVASWQTPATGRRGKGRIFLPGVFSTAIDADGQFTSSYQNAVLSATEDFLNAIEWESTLGDVRTAPIVTGAPWDRYGKITSISVGSVPDVQRRRRRSLIENRVSVVL